MFVISTTWGKRKKSLLGEKEQSIISSIDGCSDRYLVKYQSNNLKFKLVVKATFHTKNSFAVFVCSIQL